MFFDLDEGWGLDEAGGASSAADRLFCGLVGMDFLFKQTLLTNRSLFLFVFYARILVDTAAQEYLLSLAMRAALISVGAFACCACVPLLFLFQQKSKVPFVLARSVYRLRRLSAVPISPTDATLNMIFC